MTWDEVFKVTTAVFASLVGAAAIIFGFSSWLSKVWANKILQADKVRYQSELEVIKRYSEKQFYLYSDLWSSLCDLRISGDKQWARASVPNARRFVEQLKKTEDQVTRSSLLIEDGHFESLRRLMDEFGRFQFGKTRLIDLRNRDAQDNDVSDTDIELTIEANRESKEKYSQLLTELQSSFKRQIRGAK